MALLHRAQLQPSKVELVSGWLPSQPWASDASADVGLRKVASYRFDDPDGEVGVETLLVRAGDGPIMQVPLTYRASPLAGAEPSLIGTMEHSVLGTRWTYDGCGDPVYVAALAGTILGGGTEAEQYYEVDGVRTPKPDPTHVWGSGKAPSAIAPPSDIVVSTRDAGTRDAATVITSSGCRLVVFRYPGASDGDADAETLLGTWQGQDAPIVLATARVDA